MSSEGIVAVRLYLQKAEYSGQEECPELAPTAESESCAVASKLIINNEIIEQASQGRNLRSISLQSPSAFRLSAGSAGRTIIGVKAKSGKNLRHRKIM